MQKRILKAIEWSAWVCTLWSAHHLVINHADYVGRRVCPQHNSEMNDPKVFKLGTGNDLGIP